MEELVYYTMLYDIYGTLLTEKQRMYFEEYYFKNLSLSELASIYNFEFRFFTKKVIKTPPLYINL